MPRLSVMLGEDTPPQLLYDPAELEQELQQLRQKHDLDPGPPAASAATTTTATTTSLPPPSKKKKKFHVYSKWKRKRTKTGTMPGDNIHGVATKRPRVVPPPGPDDHVDDDNKECLGKPIVDHDVSDKSNKENLNNSNVKSKPLFPIFSIKKADTNFTSSKTPVFAAKAKDKLNCDVRPPPPRKKYAKAHKKTKISIAQGNTMLKYFTTPSRGRAEAEE